jgi:hypothetical protein
MAFHGLEPQGFDKSESWENQKYRWMRVYPPDGFQTGLVAAGRISFRAGCG